MLRKGLSISALFIFLFLFISCPSSYEKTDDWTLMMYMGADNNLEEHLLNNIIQMRNTYDGGCNVIVLIDRNNSYTNNSTALNSDFYETRLYRIEHLSVARIYGDETFPELQFFNPDVIESDSDLDTGDANILKKFINFCKKNYTAEHYALFIGSHGSGCDDTEEYIERSISADFSASKDYSWIDTSEFTTVLTNEQSVDVLALDACYMSNLEFLYQISDPTGFYADYAVASAAEMRGAGMNYIPIMKYFADNSSISPKDFAEYLVTAFEEVLTVASRQSTLATIDMVELNNTKCIFDEFCAQLISNHKTSAFFTYFQSLIGNSLPNENLLYYYYDIPSFGNYPYIDLYDIAAITLEADFSDDINTKAAELMEAIDATILNSTANSSYYPRLKSGKTGLTVFFPSNLTAWNTQPYYYQLACSVDGQPNWYTLLDEQY